MKISKAGTEYVWVSGIIYAIVAKKNIKGLDASFLALTRLLFLFALSMVANAGDEITFCHTAFRF